MNNIHIDTLEPNKLSFIYLSDLHFEVDMKNFNFNSMINEKVADIAILAGDIHSGREALPFIQHLIDLGYIVIYTLGNHEYWGNNIDTIQEDWRKISKDIPHFYFLEKDIITINDVDFIGCTFWTSIGTKNLSEQIDWFVKNSIKDMNDFQHIHNFNPEIMRHLHFTSRDFIFQNINPERKQVVITHYAPSELSADPIFNNDKKRTMWFSELGQEISHSNILYWIHGHMHNTSDYFIHNTNILCNPRGYKSVNMLNPNFKPLIIKNIELLS